MDSQKVDMYILMNSKYFESYQLPAIRERLLQLDDAQWVKIEITQFKDPIILLIISILVGHLGIDRFILGDVGLGIGKLLTCGGFGIWTIVDWFMIQSATKEKNRQKLFETLTML